MRASPSCPGIGWGLAGEGPSRRRGPGTGPDPAAPSDPPAWSASCPWPPSPCASTGSPGQTHLAVRCTVASSQNYQCMIKGVVQRLWMSEGAAGQGVACLEVKCPAAPPSKQRFQALKGLPCSAQCLSALTASLLSSSFLPPAVLFHLCHPDSMPWSSTRLNQGGSKWTAAGLHGSSPLFHKRLDHVLCDAPLL